MLNASYNYTTRGSSGIIGKCYEHDFAFNNYKVHVELSDNYRTVVIAISTAFGRLVKSAIKDVPDKLTDSFDDFTTWLFNTISKSFSK